MPSLVHYLAVSACLLGLGLYTVLTRRHIVGILLGAELILNAAGLNFVAFDHYGDGRVRGQLFVIFVIVIAVCEAAIALAIVLQVYRRFRSVQTTELTSLKF